MSNNNKQPLDLTASLPAFYKAQAPSTTRVPLRKYPAPGKGLRITKIKKPVAPGIPSQPVEASISDVKPGKKIMQQDVTIRILLDCAKRGENRGKQRPPTICEVPRIHRDLSKSSFTPQLVSIGPIHREDPKLKEFEWLKECYLHDLLNHCHHSTPKKKLFKLFRSRSTPKKTLEECLLKVNTLIPQIRESYAGVMKNYSDVELVTMMVMDGCFILEFCFKQINRNLYLPNKMQNLRIAMDLILLENQVPFFVLQALFDCFMGKRFVTLSQVLDICLAPYTMLFISRLPEKKSILSNVLHKYLAPYIKLFCFLLPEKNSTTNVDSDSTPAHVLGYMHKRYQLVGAKPSNIPASHSIVELDRSGMNFKPHQECGWSMSIKFQSSLFACLPWFWSKPTLLMPRLVIQDFTELILRNFIAYEQSFPQDHYYFTSYAIAMDKLIDSQEDIAKLVESKVLVNNLGSNQEAADMINKICKNIFITGFYYTQEFKQMDKYYNRLWPKHIARLRRVYFSNPWSIIALLAAFILFGLTVTQTIFTIRAA